MQGTLQFCVNLQFSQFCGRRVQVSLAGLFFFFLLLSSFFSTVSFCTATHSCSRILSFFLHQTTNPPQPLSPLLQQLNGQWQLLRASLVCYSGREVERRGPEPTSAPQLSGPETRGIKLTSSQHHFIRAPNSGPGFLLANENVQESWFHTFWTQSRGKKNSLRPPRSNKTSSGNAVEKPAWQI